MPRIVLSSGSPVLDTAREDPAANQSGQTPVQRYAMDFNT
jgi:hypothetical protein